MLLLRNKSLARINHKFSTASVNARPYMAMAGFATLRGANPASPANPRRAHVRPEPSPSRDEFCDLCGLDATIFNLSAFEIPRNFLMSSGFEFTTRGAYQKYPIFSYV